MPPAMMRIWRLSVTYIEPKSRTESLKTKSGTKAAHVTNTTVTTLLSRLQGPGAYCGGLPLPHSLLAIASAA